MQYDGQLALLPTHLLLLLSSMATPPASALVCWVDTAATRYQVHML